MKTLIALLIAMVATPALANMPPKEYDHKPSVYVNKHRVAYGQAAAKCNEIHMKLYGTRYPTKPRYGCNMVSSDGRVDVVYSYDPTGKDKRMANNTLRHEYGHINGWPEDHPNALP